MYLDILLVFGIFAVIFILIVLTIIHDNNRRKRMEKIEKMFSSKFKQNEISKLPKGILYKKAGKWRICYPE